MGVVRTFLSWNPSSNAIASLLCFQVILLRKNLWTADWSFLTWCLFKLCRFPLRRFTVHSQRNLIIFFGEDWRKKVCICGKMIGSLGEWRDFVLWSSENFNFLAGTGYKILEEWIRCLYNNVTERLLVATSQSTNDRRVQTLRVDTNQVALIQVTLLH